MKKLFFTLLFVFSMITVFSTTKAQTLDFCQSVNSYGDPIGSYKDWNCNNTNCYVYALLKFPNSVKKYYYDPYYVYYDVYKWNSYSSKYEYITTESLYITDVNNNWFSKKLYFYSSGWYKVQVYVDKNYVGFAELHWNF